MTTLLEGATSGLRIVTDPTAGTYPAWQPGRKITISKTVGGFSATVIAGIPPSEAQSGSLLNASQVGSFIWNSVQFCRGPDSGSGTGCEVYILDSTAESTQHQYNTTEPGRLGESPPLQTNSNLLAQALTDASGSNMIRIVKPTFWVRPGQITSSLPALNTHDISELVNTMTYTWGLAGNDHIIQIENSIVIPTDATIQAKTQLSLVPLYHYCPNFGAKPFTTQEWVHPTTGATRAYASDTSTTEVLMNKSADENFACAVVPAPGLIGTGWCTGLNGAGAFPYVNVYQWCIKAYPGGIPAGTVYAPVAFCFGTRADLIGASGAIVTAAANLPAAIYPS